MKVLFFPDWVFVSLKAQGYSRTDVIDEKRLLSILSLDDVAFLSLMQDRLNEVIPQSILETFPTALPSWWPSTDVSGLMDRRIDHHVNGRLKGESIAVPYNNLTCQMMDEKTLVFYPIHSEYEMRESTQDSKDSKLQLLDRVIQELYGYLTFEDLALTPLMQDFLATSHLLQRRAA